MNRVLLPVVFIIYIVFGPMQSWSQGAQISDDQNQIFKDSLGNILEKSRALELLKTGEYISIPSVNAHQQIERIIRKCKDEDGEKYQTYSSGGVVISTTGLKKLDNIRYGIGDTIPTMTVIGPKGKQLIFNGSNTNRSIFYFCKRMSEWIDVKPRMAFLLKEYPDIQIIISPIGNDLRQDDIISKNKNILFDGSGFAERMNINTSPACVVTDSRGIVLMFVPPLPNADVAFNLLKKILNEGK